MIDELRWFLLVVEHGTVTAAAQQAHLSQPALTAALKRLEDHFGARLLHRDRRGARVTAAGTALVPRAQAVLAALADAQRAVAEIEGLARGEVRIGASTTAATYLLPPFLARFRKRHPDVRIVLRELPPPEATLALERGDIDVAITAGVRGAIWRRDELLLIGSPRHRTDGAPFLTFPTGTSTRSELERCFPDPHVVMELSSIAAIKQHVRQGIGIALLSRAAVDRDLSAGKLVRIRHPATPIKRVFRLEDRGVELLPPAAAALRAFLLAKN